MLREFITTNREEIITKARGILTARPTPKASANEIDNGVPLFLSQLSDALQSEAIGAVYSPTAIGTTATLRGRDLLALGFTVSQVVHDYGDICQAVTELALEQKLPIGTAEFRTLNACLDTAIAEAVTEHARLTAESRSCEDAGQQMQAPLLAAQTYIDMALQAFDAVQGGRVPVNGVTSTAVTRNLSALRDLVGRVLAGGQVKEETESSHLIT